MGIVKRQAFLNSVFNYIGQVIGYLNIAILFPIFLSQEEFGLTRLITSLGAVYTQFSTFGVQRVAVKYFPFFRTSDSKHHYFVTLLLALPAAGFIVVSIIFFVFHDYIIPTTQESLQVQDFIFAIPIVSFFSLYFKVFDSYLKALYKTSLTGFLNNIVLKLLWLLCVILYYKNVVGFYAFIYLYFSCNLILILITVLYLTGIGQLKLGVDKYFYKIRVLIPIMRYGFFSILDDVSAVLIVNIDKIIIGFLIDLKTLAIYTVASYISTIVSIPSSSLGRILIPMISPLWKRKDMKGLEVLYRRSCLLNLMLSGAIFVLLWGSVEDVLQLIDKDYRSGIYLILIFSASAIVDLAFGLNGDIILMSKHYTFNTYSSVILLVLIVVFNFLLIPSFGVYGAALGGFVAKLLFNIVKYKYLEIKEQLSGFTVDNLKVVVVILFSIGISYVLPRLNDVGLLNILFRSAILSVILFLGYYTLRVSSDFNKAVLDIKYLIKKR